MASAERRRTSVRYRFRIRVFEQDGSERSWLFEALEADGLAAQAVYSGLVEEVFAFEMTTHEMYNR